MSREGPKLQLAYSGGSCEGAGGASEGAGGWLDLLAGFGFVLGVGFVLGAGFSVGGGLVLFCNS